MKTLHSDVLALSLCLLAGACAGGGGSGPGTPQGQSSIVLTDSANDELSMFEVDVTAIVLEPVGGGTVSVLPRSARVDFASLTELAELVAAADLPLGAYKSLTMTVDFSAASVLLKDETTPATVTDADGNPITGKLDIPVSFATGSRPSVLATKHHVFLIDLDLDQAITVDAANNKVTFVPAVSAQFDPLNLKPVATTGHLVSIDASNSELVLEKRDLGGAKIASFTLRTTTTTTFQINGVAFTGSAGLAELQKLPTGTTRVFAQGSTDATTRRLNAVAVESGAGTFGNGQDWVWGIVLNRTGGAGSDATLTVLGRSRDVSSTTRRFNTSHTVNVSRTNTKVLRRGASAGLTSDAINVGQRVLVFGTLTGTTLDATQTTGVVRMLKTSVWGTATAAPVGNRLILNVNRIGLRLINRFSFTVAANQEADPANYKIDVTGLSTVGITNGTKVRAIGFMNPVGVANDDDHDANALVNRTTTGRVMVCLWIPPNAGGITSSTASGVQLNVSAAFSSKVYDGFGNVDLTNTPPPMLGTLLTLGVYRVIKGGAIEQHLKFSDFTASVATHMGEGAKVARVSAVGLFDETTQLFQSLTATVVVK